MTAGHDEVRQRLGAFVLGQLPADQADTVREHLVRCLDCAAEATALQPMAGPLAWVDPDEPVPTEPPGLRSRVERALAETARSARTSPPVAGAVRGGRGSLPAVAPGSRSARPRRRRRRAAPPGRTRR